MKILITNHHLDTLAGSEIFTSSLAINLKKKGHEVFVYAPILGDIGREIGEQGIVVTDDLSTLEAEELDIIHAQHNTVAILARAVFPTTPMIFMSHGALPELEQAPSIDLGISKFLAVSEEVAENLNKSKYVAEDKIEIVRNFIDVKRFISKKSVNKEIKKVMILSNHYQEDVRDVVESACMELGLDVFHIGLPNNSVADVENYINKSDLVVTLGRGVLEAIACGRNVIVYDIHGGDGFVDKNSFYEIRKNNFSGRRYGKKYTVDEFKKELTKYDSSLGNKLREIVLTENSAEAIIYKLENIYNEVISRYNPGKNKFEKSRLYNEINFLEKRLGILYRKNKETALLLNKKTIEIKQKNQEIDKKSQELDEKKQEIKQKNQEIDKKKQEIDKKNQEVSNLRNSKSFQLGNLFFRSIKSPWKIITFPVNFLILLFKKKTKKKIEVKNPKSKVGNIKIESPKNKSLETTKEKDKDKDKDKDKEKEKEMPMVELDLSRREINNHLSIVNKEESGEVKSINWFIPSVQHVLFGGIYTILRFANYFQEKGIKTRLIVYGGTEENFKKIRKQIADNFNDIEQDMLYLFRGNIGDIPECDATISTLWNSCYISAKFNKTKKKFYFIQDYEPLFFVAGSERYNLSELTYRLGFRGIVNTPGLAKYVEREHGMKKYEFFHPAVEKNIYNISTDEIKKKINRKNLKIVFYGRPGNDRNAFQVGVSALLRIKERYGEKVEIISVGAEWEEKKYGVDGKIKNLGRLNSLDEVAKLYRESDIGLVFMFTKHPSYQPFEYMACGCAVVTNYNADNLWFLKDRENCLLFEPTVSYIYDSVSELIENPQLRKKIILNGLKSVGKPSWEEECEKIFNYINK